MPFLAMTGHYDHEAFGAIATWSLKLPAPAGTTVQSGRKHQHRAKSGLASTS